MQGFHMEWLSSPSPPPPPLPPPQATKNPTPIVQQPVKHLYI